MTLAYGTNESQWVATTLPEQRQQMVAYVDWEQGATRIVEVAPLLVPGLLQTSEYARAIMVDGGVSGDEIALRVTSRIDHLLEMAARPNIELRVVPNHRGWHPGLEGAFALIESPRPATGRRAAVKSASIVFVGTRRSVLMLHEHEDVAAYRSTVGQELAVSLPPEPSAGLIAEMRKRMEKQ
jgi:hypothetical protein